MRRVRVLFGELEGDLLVGLLKLMVKLVGRLRRGIHQEKIIVTTINNCSVFTLFFFV